MSDPSGMYMADDVTVKIDNAPVTKGDKAKGEFVSIDKDGTHFRTKQGADGQVTRSTIHNPERAVRITLLRNSPSNAILRSKGHESVTICVRRLDGTPVFDGDGWVDGQPRDVGLDERVWSLTAVASSA